MGRGSSGGSSGRSGGGGGVNPNNIKNETSLVSERPYATSEVDNVLTAAQGVRDQYGTVVGDFILADVVGKDSGTMAYSDGYNIGFNRKYFNDQSMTTAYDDCVKSGFHPSRGNKTAMEAVAYHEYGHVLTEVAARKMGYTGVGAMDKGATEIVNRARANTKSRGVVKMASKISRYATANNKEAIAEAFADVQCNGSKAKVESRAIINVLNNILGV